MTDLIYRKVSFKPVAKNISGNTFRKLEELYYKLNNSPVLNSTYDYSGRIYFNKNEHLPQYEAYIPFERIKKDPDYDKFVKLVRGEKQQFKYSTEDYLQVYFLYDHLTIENNYHDFIMEQLKESGAENLDYSINKENLIIRQFMYVKKRKANIILNRLKSYENILEFGVKQND